MTSKIEAAFAETLAEHLKINAEALRMMEISRRIAVPAFRQRLYRAEVVSKMRAQLAAEAFEVGLGILSCTDPLYRVHAYLAVRYEDEKAPATDQPWQVTVPDPPEMDETSVVEIRLEAIGAPVLLREA